MTYLKNLLNKRMDILQQIIAHKKKEVAERKSLYPARLLQQSIYFNSPAVSLKKYLLRGDKAGIIAEFKRKSPSKGTINNHAPVERTSIGYMQAGASALSILTDAAFFGGRNEDLTTARKYNYCPILRKDFVVDEYQLVEAKSIGADAVLLLANVLSPKTISTFTRTAHDLGLEVLLELREVKELDAVNKDIDCVGVNNRDLKTFRVNTDQSVIIGERLPKGMVKVSESGLSTAKIIHDLRQSGFNGFLIGEAFMKHNRPELACAEFIKSLTVPVKTKT
jgi:indole-3-glycerol phosphate synthase